ncbi:MAG: hypothetical protein Q9164_007265, partial [Protoblastenia rupestris]
MPYSQVAKRRVKAGSAISLLNMWSFSMLSSLFLLLKLATALPTSTTPPNPITTNPPTSFQYPIINTTSAAPNATQNSGKRGLAYNDPSLTQPFSLSNHSSKVSWTYNWYSFPYTLGQNQTGYNPAFSFVPMLWSTASDLTSVWTSNVNLAIQKYNANAVLAFNEPDICA